MSSTARLVRPVSLLAAATIALPAFAMPLPGTAPIARPDLVRTVAAGDVTGALPRPDSAALTGFKAAMARIDAKDLAGALAAAGRLPEFERDLLTWMAIRRDLPGLTPQMITAFASRNPTWPSATMMRNRAEQALARSKPSPQVIVDAYGTTPPSSEAGMESLVRALEALGRKKEASRVLATWWTTETLSPKEEQAAFRDFGPLLTGALNKQRYRMLMYSDRVAQAAGMAKHFPETGYAALAEARAAVLRGERSADAKLKAVSGDARKDPLFAFTLAEWHRRADRIKEAAEALLSVPVDATTAHADAWWVERRIVSRMLLERGDARLAYRLAAAHRGGETLTLQEAAFHSGWYALRFLNDPKTALKHFEDLQKVSGKPISRARASYWLARAEEAAGRTEKARQHYRVAASDATVFYGQLARVKLGMDQLGLAAIPDPTATDREGFSRNPLARAMMTLIAAGYESDSRLLVPELARQLPSGGQVAILARYLEQRGEHQAALQVGKIAAERGLGVERLAFPLEALPSPARKQTSIEAAMVYAIARQESAFNPGAVSKAGALGLLQLLPGTAAATAKAIGVSFSKAKLTTDPTYNAKLGAAHLKELVDEFDGSYILTFAAYNAGKRRAYEWIERFGDPRDPRVDPIDWIELIPFGETRNYVQRVTENLQVYRARLEGGKLRISEDLLRGAR